MDSKKVLAGTITGIQSICIHGYYELGLQGKVITQHEPIATWNVCMKGDFVWDILIFIILFVSFLQRKTKFSSSQNIPKLIIYHQQVSPWVKCLCSQQERKSNKSHPYENKSISKSKINFCIKLGASPYIPSFTHPGPFHR